MVSMVSGNLACLTTSTTGMSTGEYYLYPQTTQYYPYWPTTWYYHSSVTKDDGEKAIKIAKALLDKKFCKPTTPQQFIALLDAILHELKSG